MSRVAQVGVAVAHSLGAVAVPEMLHRLYCIDIDREQMPRQFVKLANKHFEIDLKNAFPPLFSDTILIVFSGRFFRTTPGNS